MTWVQRYKTTFYYYCVSTVYTEYNILNIYSDNVHAAADPGEGPRGGRGLSSTLFFWKWHIFFELPELLSQNSTFIVKPSKVPPPPPPPCLDLPLTCTLVIVLLGTWFVYRRYCIIGDMVCVSAKSMQAVM